MQFIDLKSQYVRLKEKINHNIQSVLEHGQYIMGPEVAALETALAKYVGVKHCISCSSGTDALIMSLLAKGVGHGDIVLTTPFTFIATAEAIAWVGATPLFVDIDPDTFNISPAAVRKTLNDISQGRDTLHSSVCTEIQKIKAIITVNMFGLPADAETINAIARDYGLFVIEDAAQSFGGSLQSKKSCSFSEMGCTSFFPAKPLGGYGDGGAIFTNDDEVALRLRSIRVHGQGEDKYHNVRLGMTGRLDTIQAAVLLPKLEVLDDEIRQRQRIADAYSDALAGVPGIITPAVPGGYVSAWAQYTIRTRDEGHRARLIAQLTEHKIPTAVYYLRPLHQQKVFEFLGYREEDFPVATFNAKRVLSLPMHPYLELADVEKICDIIKRNDGGV